MQTATGKKAYLQVRVTTWVCFSSNKDKKPKIASGTLKIFRSVISWQEQKQKLEL